MTKIQRVRKRPIEQDSLRYDGSNADDVIDWTGETKCWMTPAGLMLSARRGHHPRLVEPGDVVMKTSRGTFYCVEGDAFDECYETIY